jgi:hypothetical protein
MRLLSFLNQVEITLAMLQPEHADGWTRRADYQRGTATFWHPATGLALRLHSSALGDGRFSVQAVWAGPDGSTLHDRTFFCGATPFDWQTAADAVAEAMPATLPAPEESAVPEFANPSKAVTA